MDAITSNIIANVERHLAEQGCSDDCTSACRGWCRMPPPILFLKPRTGNAEQQHAPETAAHEKDANTIPIVIYTPAQLFVDGAPAHGFRKQTTGTSGGITWEGLVKLLSRATQGDPKKYSDPNIAKAARGGWSACALRDGRRLGSAFVETRLLGLDIDRHGDIEKALTAFAPFKKIVLSTYKSTKEEPRCRVLLPLSEPCRDVDLFRRAHRSLRHAVVRTRHFNDDDFDDAGSDPSRLWYLPMVPPGTTYRFEVTGGELLDLRRLAPHVSKSRIKTRTTRRSPNTNGAGALGYVEQKMREATEGHRHTTAFALATWLSEIEPPIAEHEIEAAIMPYAPRGREAEFRRTVADGVRRGRAA